MNNLILILFLFLGNVIFAQDTLTYYVTGSGKIVSKEESKYKRKVIQSPEGSYKVWDYYEDGQLQMTGTYLNDSLKVGIGTFVKYYKNGNIESNFTYKNGKIEGKSLGYYESGELNSSISIVQGKKHGLLNTFWKDGTKKRTEKYINGNFVEGKCYNQQGQEIEHFPFMILPELSGGENALQRFLSKNVNYPSKAKSAGIQGRVFINFTVGKNGIIRDINIMRSVHQILDNEAIRVVNAMPTWIPGKRDGEPVSVNYNLPIAFRFANTSINSLQRSGPNLAYTKYLNKGKRFMDKKDYKKAIIHFTTALDLEENNKEAFYNRGLCYAKLEDFKKACIDWKKCVDVNGYREAKSNIDKYCK